MSPDLGHTAIARPIWFGDARRPAFGWWHGPSDHRYRAGLVICPALGWDGSQSHYALRLLAERVAAEGFAVVRLDYDGTGDSAGSSRDPDRAAAWLRTIRSALALVRASGIDEPCLAGMRFGATLAAEAAALDGHIDQLVLWDPCASGRAFLAEQRMISAVSLGARGERLDGSIEIPGAVFDAGSADAIRRTALDRSSLPLARRALVLTRRDRPGSDALFRPTLAREAAEHVDAAGQLELLDRFPPYQELPRATIERIARWLSRYAPSGTCTTRVPPAAGPAVLAEDSRRPAMVETPVAVGPAGLFAMVTEPGGVARVPGSPTVVFLNAGHEHHIGPARMWVELARRWAAVGIRSVRMDLSGLGDSPRRGADDGTWTCHRPEAFDDVLDVATWASPDDPSNVVLVGLCSSAYQALESALVLRPRGIVAINPVVSFVPPERRAGRPLDPRRQIVLPKDAIAPVFRQGGGLGELRERFPDLAWRARILASPRRRSGRWMTRLVRQGTDVLLVCGDTEVRQVRQGVTAVQLSRLRRSGLLRLEHLEGLQHGLLIDVQRRAVMRLVTDHVLTRHGGGPAPPPAP